MADSFGIPQLTEYLMQMGLKLAHVDQEQEIIELAFHGNHGRWRMIVGIQQSGDVRKLMLIAPHIGTVTMKKRLECLEALMAVNYRIAMGKFGLDLDDGEVRLEEAIPLAKSALTYSQFQLAFGAIMQTVAMYQSLIPRIVYGDLSVQDALQACEQEFAHEVENLDTSAPSTEPLAQTRQEEVELNVHDVLAEVTRMFEEHRD
jgi:hypothetical protein